MGKQLAKFAIYSHHFYIILSYFFQKEVNMKFPLNIYISPGHLILRRKYPKLSGLSEYHENPVMISQITIAVTFLSILLSTSNSLSVKGFPFYADRI